MRTDNALPHLRHEVIVGGVSNMIFNGLIAWLLLRDVPSLTWGGQHSFAVDVMATGLLLPLIVALIVIPLQRRKLRQGKLEVVSLGAASYAQAFADRLPASAFGSACVFGLLGVGVIAPTTLVGFYLLGVEQITPFAYAIFKAAWAGVLAGVLVIPMVLHALRGDRGSLHNTATQGAS
jgi:hypothetical protein